MAKKDIIFEELTRAERVLLLSAFDYNVDSEGFILSPSGSKIQSKEIPSTFLRVEDSAFVPGGSFDVIDGTPTAISKFIRERSEAVEPSD